MSFNDKQIQAPHPPFPIDYAHPWHKGSKVGSKEMDIAVISHVGRGPTGPKGDKGDKGDIGPVGPQGSAGANGGVQEIELQELIWDFSAKLIAGFINLEYNVLSIEEYSQQYSIYNYHSAVTIQVFDPLYSPIFKYLTPISDPSCSPNNLIVYTENLPQGTQVYIDTITRTGTDDENVWISLWSVDQLGWSTSDIGEDPGSVYDPESEESHYIFDFSSVDLILPFRLDYVMPKTEVKLTYSDFSNGSANVSIDLDYGHSGKLNITNCSAFKNGLYLGTDEYSIAVVKNASGTITGYSFTPVTTPTSEDVYHIVVN